MSTQKQKFELFARLQRLGFTYEEAAQLRRIEMTLHRWAEAECNGDIQREELRDANGAYIGEGKPFRVYEHSSRAKHYPIADREAGALRRLAGILYRRNNRPLLQGTGTELPDRLISYHQSDPRGCALYLVKAKDLEGNEIVAEATRQGCKIHPIASPEYIAWEKRPTSTRGSAPARFVYTADETQGGRFDCPEAAAVRWAKLNGKTLPGSRNLPIESHYTRGLAVCA